METEHGTSGTRGQIALVLKQSGFKLPESVAVKGLWGSGIFGK